MLKKKLFSFEKINEPEVKSITKRFNLIKKS